MIHELFLVRDKECKHSVVYKSVPSAKQPFVTSVYLMKSTFTIMPSVVRLTVEDTQLTPAQAETHAATKENKSC